MQLIPALLGALVALSGSTAAFDASCNANYASYYGQNSAGNQKSLGEYCKDATEDVIVLAFMNGFPNILLNFANACETPFEGSTLLHCPNIATDIKSCQAQGKVVILSMGGASGAYGFSGDSDATKFADTVWDMFFKGKADQRPFDDAVLDGIDLDIEGGSPSGYIAFIEQLRTHYKSDPSKQYYIASAPQCPFPDAYLSTALDGAWFDMVFVQFYNNYCGLNAYPSGFNYEDWDNWAKSKAVNKDVKVYIGAPGSPTAAGSGYVDGKTLASIYDDISAKYTSLGGIMTWDVSSARGSGLAESIRTALDSKGTCSKSRSGSSNNASNDLQPEGESDSVSDNSKESDSAKAHSAESESVSSHSAESDSAMDDGGDSETKNGNNANSDTEMGSDESSATGIIESSSTNSIESSSTNSIESSSTGSNESSSTDSIESLSTGSNESSATASDGDSVSSPPNNEDNTDTASGSEDPNSSISSNCPVDGAPCSGNQLGCNGEQLAICANNVWYVGPCAPGTYCFLNNDAIICDWSNGRATDTCAVSGGI